MEADILREINFNPSRKADINEYFNGAPPIEDSGDENTGFGVTGKSKLGIQNTKVISPKNQVDEMFAERLRYYSKEVKAFRSAYKELDFPEITKLLRDYPAKKGEQDVSII